MTFRLIQADCIEAMSAMDEASIDAIVTDPPYGLEFMGKEWDKLQASKLDALIERHPDAEGKSVSPFYRPGWGNSETKASTQESQAWHHAWAIQALRVLKPGGHLLAFGGTRTYHRLACALEDAGFEIRDCLAWLYGSGFPKSLDVSKAIDKQREGRHVEALIVTRQIEAAMRAKGLTRRDLNRDILGADWHGGSAQSWTTTIADGAHKPRVPEWDYWLRLKALLGMSDEMDAEVWRLNGRKGTPGEAWGQREIIGRGAAGLTAGQIANFRGETEFDITAPATPEAQHWQGWGTALKPAWESIIWATKPQVVSDLAARIGSCLSELSARTAAEPSTSSPTGSGVVSGSAPKRAGRKSSTPGDSSDQTATSPSRSMVPSPSSIASSWLESWGDLCELTSTFTTETTSSTTTALTTLLSCLSEITPDDITADPSGEWSSRAHTADALLAGLLASSRDTLTLSAIVRATSSAQAVSLDAGELEPAFEPIVLARKPLIGSVAQNVLEHGTGALNVDGTRIGTEVETWPATRSPMMRRIAGKDKGDTEATGDMPAGRWPANLILDEEAAAMLDEQTGELGFSTGTRQSVHGYGMQMPAAGQQVGFGDPGGASRFFYVPKTDRAERNRGLLPGERNSHPTLKPVELMQWLCRLIGPPGGTILDPFAGSGSTGIAALREGFEFIGIEREAEYVEIARDRIVGDAPLFNLEATKGTR